MAELDWKFYQVFGETNSKEDVTDVDIVSAVEFNEDGNFIAAGDRGGRVVLFKRCRDLKPGANPEYTFYAEFQSHEPEFDYLKSLEIEEKINKIKWCKRQNQSLFLLTTNDKTIKLWKVFEKKVRQVVSVNTGGGGGAAVTGTSAAAAASLPLSVPQLAAPESTIAAAPRRVFSNAHAYHINSISLNSDGETFISSDDLRINLWNLAVSDQSFNIVDIKPANMEELSEVITSAEFHPTQCNIFMYSSSKGTIKLGDMRHSALCDNHAKVFEEAEDPGSKSFFSEIISSISDIKFSSDGRYLLSRDYLTIKLWDLNMERGPVRVIPIHDHLRSKLCDLYENDCIFDKFECAVSPAGDYFLTGSYHNHFHVYDSQGAVDTSVEASKFSKPKRLPALTKPSANGAAAAASASPAALAARAKAPKEEINPDMLDFSKKILHVAWHPTEHILAVGANNNLYVYGAINTNADDGASSTTSSS